jgi:diguanylate cyclase
MHYAHSTEKAGAFATQAIELMRKHGIPPDPNNFTVWYTYCAHENPELNKVLDVLIDNAQEFTEERNASVFNKFCSTGYEAIPLHLIAERLETEIATAVAVLETTHRKAAAYGESLETAQQQVGQTRTTEDLIKLLSGILTQSRAMAKQSREVEGQLRQSCSEVSSLREQLEGARREAMTDALTNLANRKMFDFVLRERAMEAMETGEPLSLLFLDIDHFKTFNDTFGHHVGDHVLKLLGGVLKDTCKGQDTPARYGGEEFAVILPRTTLEQATKLAENIRRRIAGNSIVHRKTGEQLGRVHVSIGVSSYQLGEPLRQLVERADHGLYSAKRSGRNRVVAVGGTVEQKAVAING